MGTIINRGRSLLRRVTASTSNRVAFFAVLGATSLGWAGVAGAATGATYDITPVVSGLTNDLTSNIPVILGAIGALVALGIAVHMVKRWVKPS